MHIGHANKHGTSWDGLGISGACITLTTIAEPAVQAPCDEVSFVPDYLPSGSNAKIRLRNAGANSIVATLTGRNTDGVAGTKAHTITVQAYALGVFTVNNFRSSFSTNTSGSWAVRVVPDDHHEDLRVVATAEQNMVTTYPPVHRICG